MTAVASDVWLSLKTIAERDSVSRQAISKQVARLIEHHKLEHRRDGRGRVALVNIVHFDDLRSRFGDSTKVPPAAATDRPASSEVGLLPASDATLDGARRIKLVHETELLRLRLAEDSGQLVRMDLMADALTRLAEETARKLDLVQHADVIAASAGRGLPDLRLTLKRLTGEMRAGIADRFAAIAAEAPQKDDALTEASPA